MAFFAQIGNSAVNLSFKSAPQNEEKGETHKLKEQRTLLF